ncbi:hypothetical protein [Bergeriella denitrificans]|uniref:Uncharacterized protein n=1 Tax=Bergeriella denitrificans TaxID=494 RepID=A0A378URG8_BERDE|nr:hypothetical protein [Bergeriella denitrificans]STZ76079.1 Uncharacterised protein [Bergeriella denitrificans]STZ83055.1 Uncharacterised protein [Bergeriella denitrificans]
MKKTLVALSLAALAERWPSEINITPASTGRIRQHPSLKRGKSGVAAARRAARKQKGRLKK